jgi:hypothetical protein
MRLITGISFAIGHFFILQAKHASAFEINYINYCAGDGGIYVSNKEWFYEEVGWEYHPQGGVKTRLVKGGYVIESPGWYNVVDQKAFLLNSKKKRKYPTIYIPELVRVFDIRGNELKPRYFPKQYLSRLCTPNN